MAYSDPDRQREYQRKRVAGIRHTWLADHGPCAQCGSWERLEVDHVDPKTKVNHNVWSWTPVRRDQELDKCQVLCHMCHMAKTAAENSERMGGLKHGTEKMYGKYKCRCEPCRLARRVSKARIRARRKALGLPHQ